MKILLTTHLFLPDHSAGTELIAYNIAKELQARSHEVTIVTGFPAKMPLSDDQRFDSYTYDGLPVHRFLHAHVPMGGQDNILESEYNNRVFYAWFRKFLAEHRPDLVHFVHMGRLSASVVDACRELGIPTVFTATDFWAACPTNQLRLPDGRMCTGPNPLSTNCLRHIVAISQPPDVQKKVARMPEWLLSLLVRLIKRGCFANNTKARYVKGLLNRPAFLRDRLNQIDRIIVPSRLMGEMLIANGLDANRITYLPYGIPVAHIPRRATVGEQEKLRVGFVGTLYEHKGPQVLVNAIRSLPADLPIECRFHGKTDQFPPFMRTLRELIGDDPRITLCGAFDNREVGAILGQLDLLVCPSIWYENTPLVIYEAMAAGVPVLATNLGGMAESVADGVNGFLFPAGDHAALAGLIAKLAGNRPLLQALAAGTKRPMSVPDHVAALERIYGQLPRS